LRESDLHSFCVVAFTDQGGIHVSSHIIGERMLPQNVQAIRLLSIFQEMTMPRAKRTTHLTGVPGLHLPCDVQVIGMLGIFQEMDTNGDGVLTLTELRMAMQSKGACVPEPLAKVGHASRPPA
jgi:hypothetical protein